MNNQNDVDVLSRTIYGEAEAGNIDDAKAIASVIFNRAKYGRLWPNSVAEVCLQPWQFSCWNAGDPNRKRIQKAQGPWFATCKALAQAVIDDEIPDPTRRSTHYYATYVKMPKWAKGKKPVTRVRHADGSYHLFFNDIDTPAPQNAKQALDQIRPLSSTGTMKGTIAAGSTTVLAMGAEATSKAILHQIGDNAEALTPALPIVQMLAEYAPMALMGAVLLALGYIAWSRWKARKDGIR